MAQLEPWLLLLLAERPAHGYDLLERLAAMPDAPHADRGHLYRSLRRLEGEGLVTSDWRTPLSGAARRDYTLTDEGRRALSDWAAHIRNALSRLQVFLQRCDAVTPVRRDEPPKGDMPCR